jgi:hypothetical protein
MTETAKCVRRKSGGLTSFVIFVRRGPNSAMIRPFNSLRMKAGVVPPPPLRDGVR